MLNQINQLDSTLTIVEAGATIGLSKNTCYNLTSQGKFPFKIIDLGGRKRVRMSDIQAAIAAAQVIAEPSALLPLPVEPAIARGRGRPRKCPAFAGKGGV
jgi:predicted DNA-binding transcriptional regulator AlpA